LRSFFFERDVDVNHDHYISPAHLKPPFLQFFNQNDENLDLHSIVDTPWHK
jgi:hypothetical protein